MTGGWFVVVLLLIPTLCAGKTSYLHLTGFEVDADKVFDWVTTDGVSCLRECAKNAECMVAKMDNQKSICTHLNMIRNIREAPTCAYYLKRKPTVNIAGRNLSLVPQDLQNAVYADQGVCPYGWDLISPLCLLDVTETVCEEYASFLQATFDGLVCTMPMLRASGQCSNSSSEPCLTKVG